MLQINSHLSPSCILIGVHVVANANPSSKLCTAGRVACTGQSRQSSELNLKAYYYLHMTQSVATKDSQWQP